MKCVILAGGYGTRISEESALRPKPLVEIGGKPLLWHIMMIYAKHGITDFIICGGYKVEMIEDWLATAGLSRWNIRVVDTGVGTLTGGRLRQVRAMLDGTFCLTYGDGVSDVNISAVLAQHRRSNCLATVTAVHEPTRFGVLNISTHNCVIGFEEKPPCWINGGFFVLEPQVLYDYLYEEDCPWEERPIHELSREGQLYAYRHVGFWHCVDTLRDKTLLEDYYKRGAPWL